MLGEGGGINSGRSECANEVRRIETERFECSGWLLKRWRMLRVVRRGTWDGQGALKMSAMRRADVVATIVANAGALRETGVRERLGAT